MNKRGKLSIRDFLVVSILLIVLLIPWMFNINHLTGKVLDSVSLSQQAYAPNSKLTGTFKLTFKEGDLIPKDSMVYFVLQAPKCPKYFVCNSTKYIEWCNYTGTSCDCISQSQINARCGGSANIIPTDCGAFDTICCPTDLGIGDYYKNLNCKDGNGNIVTDYECWGNGYCQDEIEARSLEELISFSSTPNLGNYTSGPYNNVDGNEPTGSGQGFGYCNNAGSLGFAGIIGLATSSVPSPLCTDSDNGQDIYTKGTCTDQFSSPSSLPKTDSCSEFDNSLTEYFCKDDMCRSQKFICPEGYSCIDGACKQVQQVKCVDSDINSNEPYYTYGYCTDKNNPNPVYDSCSDWNSKDLYEYICVKDSCTTEKYSCPYGCLDGKCKTQSAPKYPDLTVTNIGNSFEGIIVSIKNQGGEAAGSFKLCLYFKGELPIECIREIDIIGLGAGGSIDILAGLTNKDVAGKTLVAYADFYDAVKESAEDNNYMEKYFEPIQKCYDNDPENNVNIAGTCFDSSSHPDTCDSSGKLIQYYCAEDINTGAQYCEQSEPYSCENINNVCSDGKCSQGSFQDCIDTDMGDDPLVPGNCTDKNGFYQDSCSNGVITEYYCSASSWAPSVCLPSEHTCEFGCINGNYKSCRETPQGIYDCSGWNNIYSIDLSNLAIYAPQAYGYFNITALLAYTDASQETTLLSKYSTQFKVQPQTGGSAHTYKTCVNKKCVAVQGPGNDECSNNDDCTTTEQSQQSSTKVSAKPKLACANYVVAETCESAHCYWYDGACHDYPSKTTTSSQEPSTTSALKITWWMWLILGMIIVSAISLFVLKAILKGRATEKTTEKMVTSVITSEKDEIQRKYPALVSYINKAKKQGMLKQTLAEKLESKGWPQDIIEKAIKEFW